MRQKGKAKKTVAVIGYGSQGRAIAMNLRDSGYDVLPGLRKRSASRRLARRDGFRDIGTVSEVVRRADVVCFAFPDHEHGRVSEKEILPHLKPGATLLFLHGMSVHFGLVHPPRNCDVILLAPHGPGSAVREKYLSERTLSAFYAIAQNRSGKAQATVLALAKGMGIQRRRLLKTTFRNEAVGDLFGEQAVLCGGLAMLIKSGFDLLVKRGLKPEHAYLEVAYQLDLIVALIKKYGVGGMLERISVAARYGSVLSGPRVIGLSARQGMHRVLADIESGRFPRRLAALRTQDITAINKAVNKLTSRSLERAARKFAR